ncbi:hypothetical protein B0H11DRAFT_2291040 [Mycena galericulata]|nr:hypothetical protein B0H11DRAFT_2291040 [Mycena galericulata]
MNASNFFKLSYLAISLAVSFKNFKRCWLIKAFMKASVLFASSRLAILSGVGNSNYASSANSAVTRVRPWKLDVGVTEVQPKQQPQSVNHVHTDRLHTPPAPLVSSFPRAHKDRNKRVLPSLRITSMMDWNDCAAPSGLALFPYPIICPSSHQSAKLGGPCAGRHKRSFCHQKKVLV